MADTLAFLLERDLLRKRVTELEAAIRDVGCMPLAHFLRGMATHADEARRFGFFTDRGPQNSLARAADALARLDALARGPNNATPGGADPGT